MRRFIRSAMLVVLAITTGLVASSNASAAMVKTVVETVSNIQNTFTIMAAAPAQPAAPTAVAGNKSATITWTAPTNNGSAITSYTVTSIPGGYSCTASTLSCVITGLTNETAYRFVVSATNGLGTSIDSSASNFVTPGNLPKLLRSKGLPTLPTSKMVFSGDGRYAYWATAATPPVILKYDLQAGVELERITLASGTPTISSAIAHGSNGYFFFSKGYVQVNLDQFYVVASYSGTIEGSLYPTIDETGTYIYGVKNSTSSNYGTHVHKYEAATGTLVASYSKSFNSYAFLGTAIQGELLYVIQENGSRVWLQQVVASTMTNSGSAKELVTSPALCYTCAAIAEVAADNQLYVRIGRSLVQYSLTSNSIVSNFDFGRSSVITAQSSNSAPYFYGVTPNDTVSDGKLLMARLGNDSIQSLTIAPKTTSTSTSVTTPIQVDFHEDVLRVFTVTGTSGAVYEFATQDVPSAPAIGTPAFGDKSVTVRWAAPSDLGSGGDITYRVQAEDGVTRCETSELSCTVTGLTNGTNYGFNVTAVNASGSGVPSGFVYATPKRVADAPTTVSAVYGAASATVSWSAPAYNGGASISSYRVTSSPEGKTCTTSVTRSCAVTGLTNGVEYTFTVQASNVVGLSVASDPSNAVIPRTVPSAPNSVTTAFGNTEVSLTWSAPTIDGGASVTGYRVVSNPGSRTCTTDALTTACTITGLTNGTAYTFAVTAQNSEGSSSAATSATVTPATKPGAPGKPTVGTLGNGTVTLSWAAPSDTGGSAISSYSVTSNPGGKTCTAVSTSRSCTVSGLANGTAYTFTVTATNIAGTSDASLASASATPRTNPSAPTGVVGVFGDSSVTVSWNPSSNDGGSPLSTYKVTAVQNSSKTCTVLAPGTSCKVTGLTNGTTYTFNVTATNAAGLQGISINSLGVVPKTVPGVATAVTAMPKDKAATISWSAPLNNGGSAITGYRVISWPGDATCSTSSTTCTISDLTNGNVYSFKVIATNSVGDGADSATITAVPNILPAAPTSVQVVAKQGGISVSWSEPAANGGTSILSYKATATPGGAFCEVAAPALTCDISGLSNGSAYTVKVVASNVTGAGAESQSSAEVKPMTVPNAPSAPTANAGDGKLTLMWTAPGDGGSPIISYTVVDVDEPSISCTVLAPNTWCEIPELTNGMEYSFKVMAKNIVGDSEYSAASAVAVPLGLPDAPSIFEVQSLDKSVKVSYTEPLLDGGSPVVTYVVTAQPGGKTCATNLLECTVTGLTNGTDYTFTVQARNKIGLGAASEASDPVAPWGAPSAPTAIKTEAGESEVTVLWSAPSNTNFDTTSYTVTSNPGGFTCEVTGDVSCTVTDLDNGESYTFTVVATNAAGSSPASTASAATRPRTTPDAPLNAITRVISTGIEVSWIAPEFDGGSKVTFYTAFAYDFEDQPLDLTCTTSANSCVVGGLTQGDDYYFTVTASNVAGESAESEPTELVTFGAVPSKPNSVFAIAGPGEVTVSWAAPLNTGGSDISYYVAESTPGGFVCVVEGQSCVITGLTNGTSYTFTVRAANEFGESDNSIATAAVAPVAKPGQPSVVESMFISYSELLVRWTAPSASVNAYRVSLLEPNYPYTEIDAVTVPAAQLTYTFEGLLASNAYRVQVVAYGSGASYVRAAAAPARAVGPVLFTELPAVTGSVMVGKVLTAGDGLFIGTPAPTLTRSWYRCNQPQIEFSPLSADCVVIKGATATSYKLTITDLNKYVIFGLKAANAYGDTWAFGLTEAKVVSAPILSKTATLSGTSKSGRVLSAKAGTWLGSSKITYKYQWMRCTTTYKAATSKGAKCAAISKATAATYKLATADVGKYIRVVVTAANPYGKAESHSVTTGKVSK